ncbi:hypothetical protein DDZ18_10735 [Marinicauda salina]|uniref:Cell wall-binding repeat-containing protein n=1 Tax=Marinicauda salina TaxID=2135793 RepID=A0A2U2BRS4_9PROT|nr:cell wall-binding repeat-containing protein [Marinicauda salina]PWE16678.1 hypothetical protein DDZ18_10735 [Marinicauda salina]
MKTRRFLVPSAACAAAATLALAPAALAAPPTGGHGHSTPQATSQYATTGPAGPGMAYAVDLDIELRSEPNGALLAGNGLVILQGRIATDLPETAENEAEEPREALIAVDPETGEHVWTTLDIAETCMPAVTSDGRIIAQLEGQTPTKPDFDDSLVAIDEDTGAIIPDQIYDADAVDAPRLSACRDRILLSDDESHALLAGSFAFSNMVRAIDIGSWSESWAIDLHNAQGDDSPRFGGRMITSDYGDGFYVVLKWDDEVTPQIWRLIKFDWSGSEIDSVDLPGRPGGFTERTMLASDRGVAMALNDCAGAPEDAGDECLVFYDDDGGLSQRWIAYEPDTGGNNFFQSLARADGDKLVGWSELETGADIAAIDVDTGAIEWAYATGDTNNGGQLITDAAGNAYFGAFGGLHLVSLTADGQLRYAIDGDAVGGVNEPDILAAITPWGQVITIHADDDKTEVVRAFCTPGDACERVGEDDEREIERLETAVEVSQASFPADGSADTVVIATAYNYPDALAGAPLARSLDAPMLTTPPDALSASMRAEIERLGATRAVVIGSTASISDAVENTLEQDMGLAVERIAGDNRFDRAARIAERVPASTVYVVQGANADPNQGWPEALSVSALAAFEQRPILLATRDVVPRETLDAIVELGADRVVVVGGTAAISDGVADALRDPDRDGVDDVDVERLSSGPNRYALSAAVADRNIDAGASPAEVFLVTGRSFPDGLPVGPAAAKSGGVLLLVDGQAPEGGQEARDWIAESADAVRRGWIVGSEAAITNDAAEALLESAGLEE